MKLSPRTLVFLLVTVFSLTAGAGPVLAVLCAVSEHCAMTPKEEPRGCHEEEPSTPQHSCCELREMAVPTDSPRLLAPQVSVEAYGPLAVLGACTPVTEFDCLPEMPSRASGPPRLALLCTLLI